jgi:hypothetical protein
MKNVLTLFLLFFVSLGLYSQENWRWIRPIPHGLGFRQIHIDTQGHWYVSSNFQTTLIKSTDQGLSWDLNNIDEFEFTNASYRFKQNGNWYAFDRDFSNQSKVYLSSNNGNDWTDNGGSINARILDIAIEGNEIFATRGTVTVNQLFHSTNLGTTWNPLPTHQNVAYRLVRGNANELYISVNNNNQIWRTTNLGQNWNQVSPSSTTLLDFTFFDSNNAITVNSDIIQPLTVVHSASEKPPTEVVHGHQTVSTIGV